MKLLPDILNIISTARLWKNLPLLFIFLSGVAIGGSNGGDLIAIIVGLIGIAFSSVFMTHLNIITDRELDLIEKPHLYKMLSSNKVVMYASLVIEFLITTCAIIVLTHKGFIVSGSMVLLFSIIAILYSFNFFSNQPQKNRLKVHWIGHFTVLIFGYISLWAAGFFIQGTTDVFIEWLPIFIGISLSEYSLFLFESSVEHKAEKAEKLKTLVAIFGKKNTTIIALIMSFTSVIIIYSMLTFNDNQNIVLFSFLPISFLILLFLSIVSYKRLYLKSQTFKVPDLIFNFGRVYILLSVIYIKYVL